MFSGTIAENMRAVKPDATDDEIEEALRMACAWDFVNACEDGIYSRIGERGLGFQKASHSVFPLPAHLSDVLLYCFLTKLHPRLMKIQKITFSPT